MPLAASHGPEVGTTMCMFCKADFITVFYRNWLQT